MRVLQRIASVNTADPDGIGLSQSPGGAGDMLINGAAAVAGVATLAPPNRVSFTPAADESARTFTIYGTDRSDNAITEVVTGAAVAFFSTKIFKTVTQIAISAASAGAITVGWDVRSYTSWIQLGNARGHNLYRIVGQIPTGWSGTFDIEATSQNMMRDLVVGELPDDVVKIVTASVVRGDVPLTAAYTAVRLVMLTGNAAMKLRAIPTATP